MNIYWTLIAIWLMKVEITIAPTTNVRASQYASASVNRTTTPVKTLQSTSLSSVTTGVNTPLSAASSSTKLPSQTPKTRTSVNTQSVVSSLLSSASMSQSASISTSTRTPAISLSHPSSIPNVQTPKTTTPSVPLTILSTPSVSSKRIPHISSDQSASTVQTTGSHNPSAFSTSRTYTTPTPRSSNNSSECKTGQITEETDCVGAIVAAIISIIAALVVTAVNVTFFVAHRKRTTHKSVESLHEVKVYDLPEYIIIAKTCIGHRKFDPEILRSVDIMCDPFDGIITLEDRQTPELSTTVRVQSFREL